MTYQNRPITLNLLMICRHEYSVLNAESAEILTLLFPRSAVNIPYVLQVILRYIVIKDLSILFLVTQLPFVYDLFQ
jgi:hypothetical protein